jgi:hypothetical protein
MRETWLSPNRRAIWFGCIPPLAMTLIGAWLATWATPEGSFWLRAAGFVLLVLGLGLTLMLVWQLFAPRVAYENGQVLFYLRGGSPIAVPVAIVEAFFLGQGPVQLAGMTTRQEAVNLVARLSQRHLEWARRDVKHALGAWCDGYVTIRGTWCEPLTNDVVRRLNRRLHEVKQNDLAPTAVKPSQTS